MKALKGILLGLLISVCLSSYSIAANNSENETGGIQPLLDTLNIDISTLKLLNEHLVSIDKANQRALIFRRDERSFHLLDDFDFLVAELANLPEKPPLKAETEAVLKNLGAGMGESILTRITEIQQRAIDANEGLDKLSGGSLVAQQAYINSLESIHVRYYEALVNHLDSRKALGLTSDNILQQLSPNLYLYAEIIMGRIEASNATLNEVKSRAESDPANADISATLKDISANHALSLNRLESIIFVLDRLELDSSHYKAIMLSQSSNISVSFFSMKAIVSVLKASLASLKSVLT